MTTPLPKKRPGYSPDTYARVREKIHQAQPITDAEETFYREGTPATEIAVSMLTGQHRRFEPDRRPEFHHCRVCGEVNDLGALCKCERKEQAAQMLAAEWERKRKTPIPVPKQDLSLVLRGGAVRGGKESFRVSWPVRWLQAMQEMRWEAFVAIIVLALVGVGLILALRNRVLDRTVSLQAVERKEAGQ